MRRCQTALGDTEDESGYIISQTRQEKTPNLAIRVYIGDFLGVTGDGVGAENSIERSVLLFVIAAHPVRHERRIMIRRSGTELPASLYFTESLETL